MIEKLLQFDPHTVMNSWPDPRNCKVKATRHRIPDLRRGLHLGLQEKGAPLEPKAHLFPPQAALPILTESSRRRMVNLNRDLIRLPDPNSGGNPNERAIQQ
mgnify:CR=1 FL=1